VLAAMGNITYPSISAFVSAHASDDQQGHCSIFYSFFTYFMPLLSIYFSFHVTNLLFHRVRYSPKIFHRTALGIAGAIRFTGSIPFLSPNQQHLSTVGILPLFQKAKRKKDSADRKG